MHARRLDRPAPLQRLRELPQVAAALLRLADWRRVVAAYPAVPAVREGGARRGTLYLAQGARARSALVSAVRAGHLRLADAASAAQPAGGSRRGAP